MTTWDERFTPAPTREAQLALVEMCWRMKGPSGRILDCGIYRIETGLEIRCGYGPDDLLRSQHAAEIGTARELAEQWRQAAIAKGGFSEAS